MILVLNLFQSSMCAVVLRVLDYRGTLELGSILQRDQEDNWVSCYNEDKTREGNHVHHIELLGEYEVHKWGK